MFLLVLCEDNGLYLRALTTGTELHALKGHKSKVGSFVIVSLSYFHKHTHLSQLNPRLDFLLYVRCPPFVRPFHHQLFYLSLFLVMKGACPLLSYGWSKGNCWL